MNYVDLSELIALEAKEEEGDWIPITLPNGNVIGEMLVCYLGASEEASKKREKLFDAYRRQKPKYRNKKFEDIPDEDAAEIVRCSMAGTVVKDFRGFPQNGQLTESRNESGNLHEQNLVGLLAHRSIFTQVIDFSKEQENFQTEEREEIAGN